MPKFCINPLSANAQCITNCDVEIVLKNILSCIDTLLPAVKTGAHDVIYDKLIEHRNLMPDTIFSSAINNLGNRDICRLWFIYTRNRLSPVSQDHSIEITMTRETDDSETLSGVVSSDMLVDKECWISLGKTNVTEDGRIKISFDKTEAIESNVFEPNGLSELLPIYKNNPKHGRKPYFDRARGEHVAAMPLNDEQAQKLLIASRESGGSRWAYHRTSDSFYKFVLTLGNTFHGYKVDRNDVPIDLALI